MNVKCKIERKKTRIQVPIASMLQSFVIWMTVACIRVHSQPTRCTDNEHCPTDYFCEANFCRECLHCDKFHREDPLEPKRCVQSVTECGNCLKGLVDEASDFAADCVPPGSSAGVPSYVWVCIGVSVPLLAFAVLLFIMFATPKFTLFKISGITSAHTYQGGGTGGVGETGAGGDAPSSPPPPYNTHFADAPLYVQEEQSPLVKLGAGGLEGVRNGREAEAAQAARVFNNPAYVRAAPVPHSPSPTFDHEASPEPAALHDENTMESLWTPTPQTNTTMDLYASNTGSGESELAASGEGAAAATGAAGITGAAGTGATGTTGAVSRIRRGDTQHLGPPHKQLCLPQANGNRGSDGGREDGPAPSGPSVMLNFNLNVNATAVQQLNNVTLYE